MADSTSQTPIATAPDKRRDPEPEQRPEDEMVEQELLVEEVSIDGMCGVY